MMNIDANPRDSISRRESFLEYHERRQSEVFVTVRELFTEAADVIPTKNHSIDLEALNEAIRVADLHLIQQILQVGIKINDLDKTGDAPIHVAAACSQRIEVLDLLIKAGADIRRKNASENTALYIAIKAGHLETANWLLEKYGCSIINDKNEHGLSALYLAIQLRKTELVHTLISKGADLDGKNLEGNTPLHMAVVVGDLDIVQRLVDMGANVNAKNRKNSTPLLFAAFHRRTEIMKVLMKNNAYVADENLEGYMPLKLAAHQGNFLIVRLMLDQLLEQNKRNMNIIIRVLTKVRDHFQVVFDRDFYPYIYTKMSSENEAEELFGLELFLILASPIKFLNWFTKEDKIKHASYIVIIICERLTSVKRERTVLRLLLRLYCYIRKASEIHTFEANDLLKVSSRVEHAIAEIFQSDKLDDQTNVLKLLLPDATNELFAEDRILQYARCFDSYGIVRFCLDNDIKMIFDEPQVAGIVDKLFKSSLRAAILPEDSSDRFNMTSVWIRTSLNLRSCPVMEFSLKFASKVFTVALLGVISIYDYGVHYTINYDHRIGKFRNWSILEQILIASLLSGMFYQIGEVIHSKWSLSEYFRGQWNYLDIFEYIFGLVWFILRFTSEFSAARVVLALAAIPQTLALLRYLSFYRPVGELVVRIEISYEIILFIIVLIHLSVDFNFPV